MDRAIRIDRNGGPDVMTLIEAPSREPGPGEARIRHVAIGVNFIDTYHRSGLYPVSLPSGIGLEASGVVEAIGEGVEALAVGDRAAYASGPIGAYAETNVVSVDRLVRLPDDIDHRLAASVMLKGMTARYLLRRTFPLQAGQTALIHAAAGGVGQIAVQWATHIGATVIAVVGSEEKARRVQELGAAHVLVAPDDLASEVRRLTNGEGADVVYDGVGKDTFAASLDSLKPMGMMVSFGNASGPVRDFNPLLLSQKGSLYFTRPTLFHYTRTRALLQETADDLFEVLRSGAVRIGEPTIYPLADANRAHADLEARRTTGSIVLEP
jgi:NADPH2:quinone reductase